MKIVLNGEPRESLAARDVAALVAELGLPAAVTLVEHNGLALHREEWAGRPLADGDRVEIVRIVAGG